MALASTGKASDAMHGLLSAAVCACPKLVLAVAAADGASNARPELWHAALGAAPRDQVVAAFLATRALHARDALLGLMRAAHGAGPRLAFVVATTHGACAAGPLIGHAALRAGPGHALALARALHSSDTLHRLLQAAVRAGPEMPVQRASLRAAGDTLGALGNAALGARPMHAAGTAAALQAWHASRRALDTALITGPEVATCIARTLVSSGACPVVGNVADLVLAVPRDTLDGIAASAAKVPRAWDLLRASFRRAVQSMVVPLDPRRKHRDAIATFCRASVLARRTQAAHDHCENTQHERDLHHGNQTRRLRVDVSSELCSGRVLPTR
mmetsp:Transcript_23001/g.58597  ORF Transcript_23001/g.58597 Transcript_23001/m.58597 type:complete len:329 (+) Transcript_23001:711-1697(+)